MKGCDFFVIFQKCSAIVLPENRLVQVVKHLFLNVEHDLVVVIFFFADDFLHFVAAVHLHCLHICRGGQVLDQTQCV